MMPGLTDPAVVYTCASTLALVLIVVLIMRWVTRRRK